MQQASHEDMQNAARLNGSCNFTDLQVLVSELWGYLLSLSGWEGY